MGKVLVKAKIENLADLFRQQDGDSAHAVRAIEIPDAMVDTGAWGLMLPKRMIAQLGLKSYITREARGLGGKVSMAMYSAVRLTVQERFCTMDVGEIPDEFPVLIGQLPTR